MAQATLGSAAVSGTVLDQTGATVPGATVTLTDVARKLDRETTTNEAGRFVFPNVPAATYSLRVSKVGFEAYQVTEFPLQVGGEASFDVPLKVGAPSASVTVSASETALLQTESNTLGTVVGTARIEDLPLNGRNFLQLSLLAAGSDPPGTAWSNNQTGRSDRGVAVSGNTPQVTGYLVDGVIVRGTRSNELAATVSPAAIDQFKVQQSFFMVDQGPDPALINIITKGGGNTVHGEAYEFVRNESLDSRNFFSATRQDLHRNQFGGAVGGPIQKDRLWFFGNYEGNRQIQDNVASVTTPTQAMFQGNFSALSRTIYDPATFTTAAGTRTAFTGNIIPTTRINSSAADILPFYIPGSSLSVTPNLYLTPHYVLREDQVGTRVDAAPTSRQSLFVQLFYQHSNLDNQGNFPFSGGIYPDDSQFVVLQHTYSLRSNLVTTIRLGAARNFADYINDGWLNGPTGTQLGINNRPGGQGLGKYTFTSYATLGNSNAGVGNGDNDYQLDGEVNYVHGKHNVQAGVSLHYFRAWEQNANVSGLGTLGFQRFYSAQVQANGSGGYSAVSGTGDSFADFLLGMPASIGINSLPAIPYRWTQFMPFVQDSWKVTRSLTLNIGMGWFKATQLNPQGRYSGWAHGFNFTTGLLTYSALNQVNSEVVSPDNRDFTPRLGFAWQPHFLHGTVIRAGAGLYYADLVASTLQGTIVAPPFSNPISLVQTQPTPPYTMGNNIYPAFAAPTVPSSSYAASLSNIGPYLFGPGAGAPYMQQWNLSIQHAFKGKDMLEVAYTGSSDHRLSLRRDIDECRPGPNLTCTAATRPWPQYTSLLDWANLGNGSYEALMARFDHRVSSGLDLRVEYTWAKTLSDAAEINDPEIAAVQSNEKGPEGFDVRHRAVISLLYALPVGRGNKYGSNMSRALDLAVGGWTTTAISTFESGPEFDVEMPNYTINPFITTRPNRVCNGKDPSLSGNLRTNGMMYFDTNCFPEPTAGSFGTAGHNALTGPGLNNWDIGLQKYFTLTERAKLQFRCEMFNAFNHAQFGAPDSTVEDTTFGKVTSANSPRLIQLALRLVF
jgi:hypothetical protein